MNDYVSNKPSIVRAGAVLGSLCASASVVLEFVLPLLKEYIIALIILASLFNLTLSIILALDVMKGNSARLRSFEGRLLVSTWCAIGIALLLAWIQPFGPKQSPLKAELESLEKVNDQLVGEMIALYKKSGNDEAFRKVFRQTLLKSRTKSVSLAQQILSKELTSGDVDPRLTTDLFQYLSSSVGLKIVTDDFSKENIQYVVKDIDRWRAQQHVSTVDAESK